MKNVLVIKTHAIGDVIMTTPALRALKKAIPDAEISVLIGKWSSPILKNNPYVSRCIEFDDIILHKKKIFEIVKLLLKIRSMKFDTAVIFHPSVLMHLFAVLAGIKNRAGLSRNGKNFLLTASVEENGSYDFYYPINFLKLVRLVSGSIFQGEKAEDLKMNVYSNENDRVSAENILRKQGILNLEKIILIAPGGAANPKENISARIWPVEHYIDLIHLISKELNDYSIVISGGKNDIDLVKSIHEKAHQVVDLSGKTNIYEIIHIINLSQVVICNDSAVLHISLAQNRPTIGIFGPTSMKSRVPLPYQQNCVQSTEKCSPCYYFGQFIDCNEKVSCMRTIFPDQVFQKVKNIVRASKTV